MTEVPDKAIKRTSLNQDEDTLVYEKAIGTMGTTVYQEYVYFDGKVGTDHIIDQTQNYLAIGEGSTAFYASTVQNATGDLHLGIGTDASVIPSDGFDLNIKQDGTTDVLVATDAVKVTMAPDGGISIKTVQDGNEISIDAAGEMTIDTAGAINIKSAVTIGVEGASPLTTINGVAAPTSSGPFCALPACLFTGAPHIGHQAAVNKITVGE